MVQRLDLDIWRSAVSALDVRMNQGQESSFRLLIPHSTNLTLFIADVQSLVDSASIRMSAIEDWDVTTLNTPFHDQYHPVGDMYRFADQLAAAFDDTPLADGSLRMETFVLGKTYEKVEMKGVRVKWVPKTTKPSHTANPEPLPTETGIMNDARGHVNLTKKKGGKGKGKKHIEREFVIQAGSHAREVSLLFGMQSDLS
jgi:hypothetical protein